MEAAAEAVRSAPVDEPVNVVPGRVPDDYHCRCEFCSGRVIGELRRPDGTYYSRLERRQYYSPGEQGEGGHIAKTPLHIARWAVQRYTRPGEWVLDPTIGAGTTAVEALVRGRNAIGVELQYEGVLSDNIRLHATRDVQAVVRVGDARRIGEWLPGELADRRARVTLVVNNPPYSGDKTDALPGNPMRGKYQYDRSLPNLAFLNEGQEYWAAIRHIYTQCAEVLEPGGHFVIGVKDMIRQKKPFTLHRDLALVLEGIGLEHEGTAFLKHYPGTLHLHTYEKRHGVAPPLYQTIVVMRKPL